MIVGAERQPDGIRLVAIDEHGDRRMELVQRAPSVARDTNPIVSPDGVWLVFASSRDRRLDETSLWIARLAPEAVPLRLTTGASIESHPTWTPDGHAIVFASTRGGADFNLWRLAVEHGRAVGDPIRLTDAPGHEVTPTVAADGTVIYAAVSPNPNGTGEVESHLESRAADGTITKLTAGPADTSPALSPDGTTIAFARPVTHGGGVDSELWRMPRSGEPASRIANIPLTDESGPVWSRDGRFLFATSVLRGAGSAVVFSSIIEIDLHEPVLRPRMLEDHAGGIARLTPALTITPLDADALRADPEYLSELARIVQRAIEEQVHR